MKSIEVLAIFLCCFVIVTFAEWPPIHPPTPPQIGVDIPDHDLGGMPIYLPAGASYDQCITICNNTVSCRAWAYGYANCGPDSNVPRCWLKFFVGTSNPNSCRVYGIINTKPCQLTTSYTHKVDPNNTLPEYPRPQMVRPGNNWKNLNGIWQFEFGTDRQQPPFGKTLTSSILVPFPAESCLSGVGVTGMHLWYRQILDKPFSTGRTLLHFGSVDWQTTVYINTQFVGNHTGGYSGFSFDITSYLKEKGNEILIYVFDPSDYGSQPFGKQRISAITNPGGDTYTPSSGIWQTVWLENVPQSYIPSIKINTDLTSVTFVVRINSGTSNVNIQVKDQGSVVATASGLTSQSIKINIPSPKTWSSWSPFLYTADIQITSSGDAITTYFGLRTIEVGKDSRGTTRPLINGNFTFLAGWLDQSFWPDGIYTAPTDEALASDLYALKIFGFNFVRLHQKVNPERWYWYADKIGIIVQQDMVQHYGDQHGIIPNHDYYMSDLKAMIDDRGNHPCIVQWTAFNEDDMVSHFNPQQVVQWIENYDPSRTVDTDSGGPANNLHIGDVNDVHTYVKPGDPKPSATQYAEVGEWGGIGAFVSQHEWVQNSCGAYQKVSSPNDLATEYISLANTIISNKKDISICVYTQITDVELECDGFLNYDRTNKFSAQDTNALFHVNQQLINTPV